ncbi:Acetyltransferase (GNAT) family protein [Mesorhizobium albiziae]|uniref:Acetyltransferase (GNAT) family protein n=1 Tax=Neomesorhizobium albiziae TaxID=335020 RepID=A0A1I3YX74_9HYPH|nr:hypothetical protein GCM10007937_49250 [Mesorhizobium albiziae]SFK36474.1 Acetyltransferase (GNAT) family protein [Mesorhizobium albiziae]
MGKTELTAVLPWFDDADTRRWLGGRSWPAAALKLADGNDNRHVLLAVHGDTPVGLADVERYADGRASFANITAPSARRRGFGTSTIGALLAAPLFSDVVEFFAGVEDGNLASENLLRAAGFTEVTGIDADGFRHFAWSRPGRAFCVPWQPPAG